jgi:hypothetical protein
VVSFLFGLVHGFGFAGALGEVGLPASGLAVAIVGFNLAVGAGQALIVGVFPNASDVIYNALLASSA